MRKGHPRRVLPTQIAFYNSPHSLDWLHIRIMWQRVLHIVTFVSRHLENYGHNFLHVRRKAVSDLSIQHLSRNRDARSFTGGCQVFPLPDLARRAVRFLFLVLGVLDAASLQPVQQLTHSRDEVVVAEHPMVVLGLPLATHEDV